MPTNYARITEENIARFGTAIDEYGPQLLADRYSDRTHFVYELLQNAEDAIGWRSKIEADFPRDVEFHLSREGMTFRHYGLPFSEVHVRGICNIGKGTKGQDLTAIGKHGIGFKSVYAYTLHPSVHSGDEHFVIDSFVRPRAIDCPSTTGQQTVFEIPFDHPNNSAEEAYGEILGRLEALGLKTLMFLRNIESIRWTCDSGEQGEYLRESEHINQDIERVTLLGESSTDSDPIEEQWLILRKEVFHRGRSAGYVEVAFELETDDTDPKALPLITRGGFAICRHQTASSGVT